MYTKFYDDTIITKFIKYLLSVTYVPLIKTFTPNSYIVEGVNYLYPGKLLKAKVTDTVNTYSSNYFDVVKNYVPDESYFNINSLYISNTSSYDTATHIRLGNYLRFLRDYYGINLMYFYNCFAGEYVNVVGISEEGTYSTSTTSDLYKVLSVPVKFGQTYNIAIDCDTKVEMACGFMNSKGIVTDINETFNNSVSSYDCANGIKFSSPFVYRTVQPRYETSGMWGTQVISSEKLFRLFIRIPTTCTSSIVVIEGDLSTNRGNRYIGSNYDVIPTNSKTVTFTNFIPTFNSKATDGRWVPIDVVHTVEGRVARNTDGDTIANNGNQIDFTSTEEESYCVSPLGLLQWNDENTYAFSDRLIEYLLLNVVTPHDTISKNIQRLQESSSVVNSGIANYFPPYSSVYSPGVWEEGFRSYLFELMRNVKITSGYPQVDILGYGDKDVERQLLLRRGRN